MVYEIFRALAFTLKQLYPDAKCYLEEAEQIESYPAFLIGLVGDQFNKEATGRFISRLEFQIAYIREDYQNKDYYKEIPVVYEGMQLFEYNDQKYRTEALTSTIQNRTLYITGIITTMYRPQPGESIKMENIEEMIT